MRHAVCLKAELTMIVPAASALQTFLITRPLTQAQPLARALQQRGDRCLILPTLEIKPVPAAQLAKTLRKLPSVCEHIIFTSANAVYPLMPCWAQFSHCKSVLAIGPATAATLAEFGIQSQQPTPPYFHSEGLLALPVLTAVKQQQIIIFSGQGGRKLLEETLRQRGAEIVKVAVYRCTKAPTPETLPELAVINAIISNSVESLQALVSLYATQLERLHTPALFVISENMALLAKRLGFTQIIVCENASNAAVIAAVSAWQCKQTTIDLDLAKQSQ